MVPSFNNVVVRIQRFIVLVKADHLDKEIFSFQKEKIDSSNNLIHLTSNDEKIELAFTVRGNGFDYDRVTLTDYIITLLLGDSSEWKVNQSPVSMAYGASIECNLTNKTIKALSSLVGLPPIFIYHGNGFVILTSDLYLFSLTPFVSLRLDPIGILDLGRIGHPIDNRTLFSGIMMAPGGHSLTIKEDVTYSMNKEWSLPISDPIIDWGSYINRQMEVFLQSLEKIDLSKTIFSLTGGLDTRTILAGLLLFGRKIPAITLTGKNLSLDARIARKLCKSYEIPHRMVIIDDKFETELIDYTIEASRLSGGLVSLEQAHEVFFYKEIESVEARLSGNLGNQIGRGGTERITMRNVNLSILNQNIIEDYGKRHWYNDAGYSKRGLDFEFLLQKEIPFSSVANYCIGNKFLLQQSPYASIDLIENGQRKPIDRNYFLNSKPSVLTMRLQDLKHRFIGMSSIESFQVEIIKKANGVLASCPINWGWKAKGGISFIGTFAGLLASIDMVSAARLNNVNLLKSVLNVTHISGLHEIIDYKSLVMKKLRDFIIDTLQSDLIRKCGIFDNKNIKKLVENHYSSSNSYKEIIFALDIALAIKNFKASI